MIVEVTRRHFIDILLQYYTYMLVKRHTTCNPFKVSKKYIIEWCEKHGDTMREIEDLYIKHKDICKAEKRYAKRIKIEIKSKEMYEYFKRQNWWKRIRQ